MDNIPMTNDHGEVTAELPVLEKDQITDSKEKFRDPNDPARQPSLLDQIDGMVTQAKDELDNAEAQVEELRGEFVQAQLERDLKKRTYDTLQETLDKIKSPDRFRLTPGPSAFDGARAAYETPDPMKGLPKENWKLDDWIKSALGAVAMRPDQIRAVLDAADCPFKSDAKAIRVQMSKRPKVYGRASANLYYVIGQYKGTTLPDVEVQDVPASRVAKIVPNDTNPLVDWVEYVIGAGAMTPDEVLENWPAGGRAKPSRQVVATILCHHANKKRFPFSDGKYRAKKYSK